MRASVVVADGLSCGSWALERRLSGCGQAQLPQGMWDLPRQRIKPALLPTLAGGVFTIEPLGKPRLSAFAVSVCYIFFASS